RRRPTPGRPRRHLRAGGGTSCRSGEQREALAAQGAGAGGQGGGPLEELLAGGSVRVGDDQRLAVVAALAEAQVDGDAAEQGSVKVPGEHVTATLAEDLVGLGATGADEGAHVLDHPGS